MSGVRIYDLARELQITNADALEMAKDLGEAVKSPSSSVSETVADSVRERVQAARRPASAPRAEAPAPVAPTADMPVAIPQIVASAPQSAPAVAVASPVSRPASNGNGAPRPVTPPPAKPENGTVAVVSAVKNVEIPEVVTLKEFADLIGVPAPTIQKKLMGLGVLASMNQKLSSAVTIRLAKSFGVTVTIAEERAPKPAEAEPAVVAPAEKEAEAPKVAIVSAKPRQKVAGPVARPPVVTIMGHVDHGKTSLLDAIRHAKVAAGEFGGITQHIGAYQVAVDDPENPGQKRKITFLDTPGHEAFTAMRARGAQVTDIAVLVVAADDGIMPQTIEAIQHAQAAQVPIIVAVNKIDKEDANPTRVLTQLTEYNIIAEAYGGDVQTAEVSAKERLGLDELLEKILLVADAEVEPKADPTAPATGTVIEAELDKGRGAVATILVEQGTLKMGDSIVAGATYGRIKAMLDDHGKRVKEAGPAMPVEILGLNAVPNAGDRLEVVKDEKTARQVGEERASEMRDDRLVTRRPLTLEELQRQIKEGGVKELNLIIKGDVQGSVEAIKQSLEKIKHPEVRVRFIGMGVGAVGDSDVLLASASQALILGFNAKSEPSATRLAEAEHIEIREYRVIYDLIDDVKKAMAGLLDPIYEENALGMAQVRAVFKLPKTGGNIAGSYITEGKVVRGANVRVRRNNRLFFEGKIDTLKREKDDVREVAQGYECGILIPGYDPQEEDIIACHEMKKIERTL